MLALGAVLYLTLPATSFSRLPAGPVTQDVLGQLPSGHGGPPPEGPVLSPASSHPALKNKSTDDALISWTSIASPTSL